MVFDTRRAMLKGPDLFARFSVPPVTVKLTETTIPDNEQLIVFQRSGNRRALLVRQMAYHHVAQGELAGEPFLISF